MIDSMYEAYVKERQKAEILKSDYGFLVYKFSGPECFIVDFFIKKEVRSQQHCVLMLESLEKNCCRK